MGIKKDYVFNFAILQKKREKVKKVEKDFMTQLAGVRNHLVEKIILLKDKAKSLTYLVSDFILFNL